MNWINNNIQKLYISQKVHLSQKNESKKARLIHKNTSVYK